jgi:hypothetical protein
MSFPATVSAGPQRLSRIDQLLMVLRLLALLGFLGGLFALAMLWAFGPTPHSIDQWEMLIGMTRAIFYPCVFAGIILLVVTGLTLWWRHRRELHGSRWFRLMMILVLLTVPPFHLWARWTMLKLRDAIERTELETIATLWNQLGLAYLLSFVTLLMISAIGIIKPRMGQSDRTHR